MKNKPITIISAIYGKTNEEIIRFMDSLLRVKEEYIEIILINDNDPKIEWESLIKKYSNHQNVSLYKCQTNMYKSIAIENHIGLVKSDYVYVMDPDDHVDSKVFEKFIEAILIKNKYDFIVSAFIKNGKLFNPQNTKSQEKLKLSVWLFGPDVIYKTKLLKDFTFGPLKVWFVDDMYLIYWGLLRSKTTFYNANYPFLIYDGFNSTNWKNIIKKQKLYAQGMGSIFKYIVVPKEAYNLEIFNYQICRLLAGKVAMEDLASWKFWSSSWRHRKYIKNNELLRNAIKGTRFYRNYYNLFRFYFISDIMVIIPKYFLKIFKFI